MRIVTVLLGRGSPSILCEHPEETLLYFPVDRSSASTEHQATTFLQPEKSCSELLVDAFWRTVLHITPHTVPRPHIYGGEGRHTNDCLCKYWKFLQAFVHLITLTHPGFSSVSSSPLTQAAPLNVGRPGVPAHSSCHLALVVHVEKVSLCRL